MKANNNNKYMELVSYLPEWPKDSYVLCGSACLAVRGVRDVHDLDVLIIDPDMWKEVEALHSEGHFPKATRDISFPALPHRLLRTGQIDFFDRVTSLPLSFSEIVVNSDIYDGHNIISLRHCLATKALSTVIRDKDIADMPLLCQLISDEYC